MARQTKQPWDGERLRRLRDSAEVTQRDLAFVLQVHAKTIAAAEGDRKPIPERCEPWLEVLERAVEAFEPMREEMREASVAFIASEFNDGRAPSEPWRLFRYLGFYFGRHPVPDFWYGALALLRHRHGEKKLPWS